MSTDLHEMRPCKRTRTWATDEDSHSSPPQGGFERSAEFWFDDGSIVLIAQDTGFRVYRALLATQSTVFSDMFSSSSPNAEEMFEGCPLVHMSESAVDVAHFLRVLLQTSHRTLFSPDARFSFDQISAIIRLAHKYDIQDVLEQAISSLQTAFTSDFSIWQRDNKPAVDMTSAQCIGVVNLARLVDRPSLLPTAFYRCALQGSQILDGYQRADASVEHLHPEDLKRSIRGRNILAWETNQIVSKIFMADPCEECLTHARCQSALRSVLESVVSDRSSASPDVLRSWEKVIGILGDEHGLCNVCQRAAVGRQTAAGRRVWNALPHIFDIKIDGWVPGEGDVDGADAATV